MNFYIKNHGEKGIKRGTDTLCRILMRHYIRERYFTHEFCFGHTTRHVYLSRLYRSQKKTLINYGYYGVLQLQQFKKCGGDDEIVSDAIQVSKRYEDAPYLRRIWKTLKRGEL